jgi:biopolymer transport protein ExbB
MVPEQLRGLGEQAVTIWLSGGWAMIALAINALVLFSLGVHVYLKLLAKGYRSVPEKTWRQWICRPDRRRGPIGRLPHRARFDG